MGHVREYTSKEVTDFLQQIGFEIEGIIYRGSYSEGWFWKLSQQLVAADATGSVAQSRQNA
jgi:hypothetical protein